MCLGLFGDHVLARTISTLDLVKILLTLDIVIVEAVFFRVGILALVNLLTLSSHRHIVLVGVSFVRSSGILVLRPIGTSSGISALAHGRILLLFICVSLVFNFL